MAAIIRSIFLFAAASVLLLDCAHRGAPSGGPLDKTPPEITETVPGNGSLNVKNSTEIIFNFSEWIEPQQAEKSISVYPSLADGFKVEAYGKKVSVIPAGKLRDSTTYHVEIDNQMKDLRGNSLANPFHMVFSTGPFLDSGKIRGCVLSEDMAVKRPDVAIYDISRSAPVESLMFLEPDYITQVDSQFNFSFRHVRMAEYLCVAFEDSDGNGCISPLREKCYSSIDRIVNTGKDSGTNVLYSVTCDTSSLSLTSIKGHSGKYVFCKMSRSLPFPFNPQALLKLEFRSKDSTAGTPDIDTVFMKPRSSEFIVKFAEPLVYAGYECVYQKVLYNPMIKDTIIYDTAAFNAEASPDTVKPVLEKVIVPGGKSLNPDVRLVWSEPVFPSDSCTMFLSDSVDTVKLSVFQKFWSDTTLVHPVRSLLPGRKYKGLVSRDCFRDLYGNTVKSMSDTVDTDISFPVVTADADSLCTRLSGGAPCLESNSDRVWIFQPFNLSEKFIDKNGDKSFVFDSIPAGKGRAGYFSDRDGDGLITEGSLFPWYQPEPWYIFADTVEARARWEIEGIIYESCGRCSEK